MVQDNFPVVRFTHACRHAQRPVEEIHQHPLASLSHGCRERCAPAGHTQTHIFPKYIKSYDHETVKVVVRMLTGDVWNLTCYSAFTIRFLLNAPSDTPEEQSTTP